ncbi:MAG: cobyrinate a,c-diamide synthase [Bacteroidaceae bacterium]|nr:cobyrinate a,c-diamide synthase [Bacteroidaceae bacterium]
MIQILVGAAASGSGKTTFTMGLMRALTRRGLKVQPFKCGPDYIDTQFHTIASGRQSVNLDTWMASAEHVRSVYSHYAAGADAAVVEGVMGLFDGYDRMRGSSAEIASLLDVPVLLVLNARSAAYSVAALLHGMKTFRPDVRTAAVVFNNVSSESHYVFLKEAASDAGVECLGWIPHTDGIEVPSRHLGLTLGVENELDALADRAADLIEAHVDVDRLVSLGEQEVMGDGSGCSVRESADPVVDSGAIRPFGTDDRPFVTAVAMDRAFNFCYRENLDRLAEMGDVRFFSPLAGEGLPEADFVYLPGGYPELFAQELSLNRSLASQLAEYAEKGGRILAECGGMMFLSRSITDMEGKAWPMAGVLPIECTMHGARLHLGYRSIEHGGKVFRGHEFHYSRIVNPDILPNTVVQTNARGVPTDTALYRYRNVIAGYTHWYWGENDIFDLWE